MKESISVAGLLVVLATVQVIRPPRINPPWTLAACIAA